MCKAAPLLVVTLLIKVAPVANNGPEVAIAPPLPVAEFYSKFKPL